MCIFLDNQASRLMTPFVHYIAYCNMTISPNRAALPNMSYDRASAVCMCMCVRPNPNVRTHWLCCAFSQNHSGFRAVPMSNSKGREGLSAHLPSSLRESALVQTSPKGITNSSKRCDLSWNDSSIDSNNLITKKDRGIFLASSHRLFNFTAEFTVFRTDHF